MSKTEASQRRKPRLTGLFSCESIRFAGGGPVPVAQVEVGEANIAFAFSLAHW
jgi:hypothetical protein